MFQGNRSEDFRVDQEKAREDARSLLQAGKLVFNYSLGISIIEAILYKY